MNMRRRMTICRCFFWLPFLLWGLIACHGGHGHDHGAAAPVAAPGGVELDEAEAKSLGVATESVRLGRVEPTILAAGELRPAPGAETRIASPGRGLFLPISPPVRAGQTVSRGDSLGQVAVWTSDPQGEQVVGEWDAAWTLWQGEKRRLERARKLVEKGLEPVERLEEIETQAELARARLNVVGARLERSRRAKAGQPDLAVLRELRAPADGIVTEVVHGEGQAVDEGDTLFRTRDDTRLELRVRVFAEDLGRLGDTPTGWFRAPGEKDPRPLVGTAGEVPIVLPGVDPETRSGTVLLRLDNPDRSLRGGLWVRVGLRAGDGGQGPVVPRTALVREGFYTVAFVREKPGVFSRRRLKLGLEDERSVLVLDGLTVGDQVVVSSPQILLYHGAAAVLPQSAHTH